MNRENRKKSIERNYYKTHPCNETFVCKVCGKTVVPTGAGSDHRNHCPYCLSSQHLDNEPGDRAADCGGVMKPISSPPFPLERIEEMTRLLGSDGELKW